jgi:hypothetical protein
MPKFHHALSLTVMLQSGCLRSLRAPCPCHLLPCGPLILRTPPARAVARSCLRRFAPPSRAPLVVAISQGHLHRASYRAVRPYCIESVCCKHMCQVFQMFQIYFASVLYRCCNSRSKCCICCNSYPRFW